MNLFEMTKKYGEGKGAPMMWETVAIISDAVEASMPEAEKDALERRIYGMLSEGHYNEQYATEDVARMSYREPRTGMIRKAPYWSSDMVRGIYDSVKGEIREYNCWDFYVTLHLMATKNAGLLAKWFPSLDDKAMDEKYVEMAVNWLKDDTSTKKIWCELNK